MESEMDRRKVKLMKNTYKLVIYILVLLPVIAKAEDEKMSVTRVVSDAPAELFATCSSFYSRLKSPDISDIKFVSGTIAGVPKDQYCVSNHVDYAKTKDSTTLLLYSVKGLDVNEIGYVVCVVSPYKEHKKLETSETRVEGWLQGNRRFDVWHFDGSGWKVVLGVNPSDNEIDYWFKGNESVFSSDVEDISGSVKLKLKQHNEVELIRASQLLEAIKNTMEGQSKIEPVQ